MDDLKIVNGYVDSVEAKYELLLDKLQLKVNQDSEMLKELETEVAVITKLVSPVKEHVQDISRLQ